MATTHYSLPLSHSLPEHHNTTSLQTYQVAYVIVKAANTPRPGNWILERSIDGVNYKPWQYYAVSDSECLRLFGVPPTRGIPHYKRDDDVICTSRYSKLNPLENGEIHTSIVNGRPGIDGPSATLLEFTQARYVRLRLQKIRTLNADLMTFIYSNPKDLDPSVTNRYFYSIKDISIGGLCFCLGRARGCEADPFTGELRCVCEDHTCGVNCNECCPRFNQLPWQPASYKEGPICGECECYNHSMACQYNQTVADYKLSINTLGEYEGGGVCQQCQHHTMGINCEMCADGYYWPRGIDQRRPDSCHMCLCDVPGSIGLCIKDDLLEYAAIYAGDCLCREGYCGPRCGECSPGYKGFPLCLPCTCDRAGSINVDICDDTCVCKGFYNLQALNYQGCDPCFCFGISNECHSSIWGRMKLQDMSSWTVTDLVGSGYMIPSRILGGHVHMVVDDARHLNRALYWAAPEVFLGNKVTAYGGILDFKFSFRIDTNISKPDSYVANQDIILEGSGVRIGIPGRYYDENTQHIIIINMTEAGWCHLVNSTSPKGFPVSRNDFMLLLGRISRLLIRASFHVYQTEATLYWMNMDVASEWGHGLVMAGVETCVCPPGYAGTSCESCAPGYRRTGDILYGGVCEPCHCHNHSYTCDSITGECLSCTHNTQGAYCEECAFGYYGNATDNTPDACRPCACPLPVPSNNFAQGCVATPGSSEGEYVCIGCPEGYMGSFCEICEPGYYGDPMLPGSSCRRCNCNGNSPNGDTCNPINGQCYDCLGKTEGSFCEQCQEGYYGSAVDNDCKVCDCYGPGSVETSCDHRTGQCTCRGHFAGRQCHRCQDGYGQVNFGCVPCDCNPWGSVTSTCDSDTGQCECKPGVEGVKCDRCQPRHYGFSSSGCRRCLCHVTGASNLDCHPLTGQCPCKRNVRGQACDECMDNHWNVDSGCQPCLCNMTGSVTRQCDDYTGQCQCHPQVTGRTCDRCLPGYYGFSSRGCRVCDRCDIPGHICHPQTGHCVCPPYTEGRHCEKCTFDAWGYDPQKGCQPCACHPEGSLDTHCDLHTGQCMCLDSYMGRQCDQCQSGHFGFPTCQPCDCNRAGTVMEKCGDTRGQCECRDDGQCPCKANVYKRRCTSCVAGSFSMRTDNPSGCTPCFCFRRSSQCHQAPYVWSQVSLPDRSAVIHFSQNETLALSHEGFLMIPPGVGIVAVKPAYRQKPLYWQLPSMLLGDMTLSYNGKLTFKVAKEVAGGLAASTTRNGIQHPLVIMLGKYNLQLSYEITEPMTSGNVHEFLLPARGERLCYLREDLWRDARGRPASRYLFMVTLQNVHNWLVKASDSVDIAEAHLLDVTMQEAVPAGDDPPNAFGVEQCVCRAGYTGLSCQDPAPGYYRSTLKIVIDITGNVDPMDLVSRIYPCQCYGHASMCNKDTGICQNCGNSTAGDNCEFCQRGYYGDPTNGYTCRPCACPRVDNNFSSSCHVTPGGYFICDACDKGYTGVHCERCAHGYYGNPLTPGGRCMPCDCNPEGTRNDGACDPKTGACDCHPGVTGRHCDVCQPKYALFNGACISCYEGCPGILMASLDENERALDRASVSSAVLPPWKLLSKTQEHVSEYRELLRFLPSRHSVNSLPDSTQIRSRAASLTHKANGLWGRGPKLERSSADTRTKATALLKEVSRVTNTVNGLPRLIGGVVSRRLDGGVWDISDALGKVKVVMDVIKNKNFSLESANAEKSLRDSQELLEKLQLIILQHTLDPARVRSALNHTRARLTDLDQQLTATLKTLVTRKITNSNNKQLLDEMRQTTELLRSQLYSVVDRIQVAAQLNEDSAFLLWNVSSKNYEARAELFAQLPAEVRDMKNRVATFEQDLPHVEPLVRDAERHAMQLYSQQDDLDSLFSGTRKMAADPLRAATAYKDMAAAIHGAHDAANEARAAVKTVSRKITEQSGHSELPVQATEALRVSRELHDRATQLQTDSSDLESGLDRTQQLVKDTLGNNVLIDDKLWDLQHYLKNFTTDLSGRVHDLGSRSSATATHTAGLVHDIRTMQAKADHVLRPKLREMTELSRDGTDSAVTAVRTAKVEVRRLTNMTRVLDHQRARLEQIGSDVGRNLAILKERIWQAREQAKNIKVSMQSDGDCVHRYEADLEPSTTNIIRLFFKTTNVKENMLLFLLRNPYASDYLALELVNSRVRFSWDVGAGGSLIEHDLPIVSAAGKFEEADKWYKVEAMRTANVGRLSVKLLSSLAAATEVSTSAVASHIKLDVDATSHLFVGGVSKDYKVPGLVTSRKFIGCIGDVSLDGKRIGLYNFRQLEGAGCSGCKTVPRENGVSGVYQFDGSGFSQLPQVRLHPERLSITFRFKTFWEEALLFLTVNEVTRDVMSVHLEGGHVVFQYSFHGRPSVRLQSRHRYNRNKWVTVVASRMKLEGMLKVSEEMLHGVAPGAIH
ncbi:hypothetical protein NP493_1214g00017 [Ridgeia piscesae]|uniref:Laminin subunit alpha-2 n=1 Tax=Ridgeia piscesae TaxID=27915 RepID=A0AAD9KCL6_RIDPI|nr:hypothetical protein NP493_1214g00017 [Ridgeia piscesae]